MDAVATELGVRLLKPAINSSLAMDILHDNYTNPASVRKFVNISFPKVW